MARDLVTNDFKTTLTSSLGNLVGDTSVSVAAAAPVPLRGGQWRALIYDLDGSGTPQNLEYVLVTATGAAGASPYTITRAVEAPYNTRISHPSGSILENALTVRGLKEAGAFRPLKDAATNLGSVQSVTFDGPEKLLLPGPLNVDLTVTTTGEVDGAELLILPVQSSPARTLTVNGTLVTLPTTNGTMGEVLVRWVEESGAPVMRIVSHVQDATGGSADLTPAVIKAPGTADRNLIQSTADAVQGLVVRRRAGGTVTANTFDVQDAAGTTSALKVEQAGYVSVNMPVATGTGGYQMVVRGDGIFRRSSTDVPGPTLEWWKSRGGVGTEADVAANDEIGAFIGRAYKGGWKGGTYIGLLVTGVSGSNVATAIDFGTTNGDGSWPGSNVRMRVGPDGKITVGRGTAGGAARLDVASGAAGEIGLIVKANGTPTANLAEFRDSSEVPLFAINPSGRPRWQASGIQQTTVGAAGGASAPPATPTKYLQVVDSAGTTLVIPAYAAA